jgi:hypothetical protein
MASRPTLHPPDLMHDAIGQSAELARRNLRLAALLVLVVVVVFAATFGVAFLYLSLS